MRLKVRLECCFCPSQPHFWSCDPPWPCSLRMSSGQDSTHSFNFVIQHDLPHPLSVLWSIMTSLIHFHFCDPTWLPSSTFSFVIQHDFPHPLSVLWSNMWLPSSTFTFVIQHGFPHPLSLLWSNMTSLMTIVKISPLWATLILQDTYLIFNAQSTTTVILG